MKQMTLNQQSNSSASLKKDTSYGKLFDQNIQDSPNIEIRDQNIDIDDYSFDTYPVDTSEPKPNLKFLNKNISKYGDV